MQTTECLIVLHTLYGYRLQVLCFAIFEFDQVHVAQIKPPAPS